MKELVRAIGGLLTIITLLAMVVADVVVEGASLSVEQLQILVVLVGGLLGLDIMLDRVPISMGVELSKTTDDSEEDGDDE